MANGKNAAHVEQQIIRKLLNEKMSTFYISKELRTIEMDVENKIKLRTRSNIKDF